MAYVEFRFPTYRFRIGRRSEGPCSFDATTLAQFIWAHWRLLRLRISSPEDGFRTESALILSGRNREDPLVFKSTLYLRDVRRNTSRQVWLPAVDPNILLSHPRYDTAGAGVPLRDRGARPLLCVRRSSDRNICKLLRPTPLLPFLSASIYLAPSMGPRQN